MSLFELEDTTYRYGETVALDIPHLVIEEGGIVCLTGANGSGKSTLLHLLGGLLDPTSGHVIYRGMVLSRAPRDLKDEVRREMGICLQSPYLFRGSVQGNVSYGLSIRGIRGSRKALLAEKALGEVGLEGFGKRKSHALSGGESQRVALARALVLEPRVLLLDEPMANVDAATKILLERTLKELNRVRGLTVILSTHDTAQALSLGDRIVSLHDGRIMESGMENIFHGSLSKEGNRSTFDTGSCELIVASTREEARTAIISPDAIILSPEPVRTSARNVLRGTVTGIRMRNGSVEVLLDAGEEFVSRITEGSMKKLGLHLGTELYLLIKAEAIKLY
jgi:tungstate transport system ATP-binding protein